MVDRGLNCEHELTTVISVLLLNRFDHAFSGDSHHSISTPARIPMAVLCSACRSSDAVQKVFIATARLRSQLWVRHSSGQQGRSSPSDLHQCLVRDLDHRPSDQYACTNTSSPTDRGPTVVLCEGLSPPQCSAEDFHCSLGLFAAAVRWSQQLPSSKNGCAQNKLNSFAGDFPQGSLAAPAILLVVAFASLFFQEDETLRAGSTVDDFLGHATC